MKYHTSSPSVSFADSSLPEGSKGQAKRKRLGIAGIPRLSLWQRTEILVQKGKSSPPLRSSPLSVILQLETFSTEILSTRAILQIIICNLILQPTSRKFASLQHIEKTPPVYEAVYYYILFSGNAVRLFRSSVIVIPHNTLVCFCNIKPLLFDDAD